MLLNQTSLSQQLDMPFMVPSIHISTTKTQVKRLNKIMRFKEFLYLFEALTPEVREVLAKARFPVAQDILAAAIKELEDAAEIYKTPADGIKALRDKLGLGAAKEKQPKGEQIAEPTDPKLKPFYQAYKEKKLTVPEYKTAVFFKDEDPSLLKQTLNELRELIATNQINYTFTDQPVITFRDANVTNYKNLSDFAARIHDIQARIKDPAPAGFEAFRDPSTVELEKPGLQVWPPPNQKGPNESKIWIFKGDDFMKCKYFGGGVDWCVTKSPLNYWDYRDKGQTQYFLYDFNKKPDDPARFTNPGVSKDLEESEWVDLRNSPHDDKNGVSFGIKGYETLEDYKKYLQEKGIPVDKILTAEPPTEEELFVQKAVRNSHGIYADQYLPHLRKMSKNAVLLFLSLLDSSGSFLSEQGFRSLSPEEKEAYMITPSRNPRTDWETDYIANLTRKQAREYLDDTKKIERDAALALRYDNKLPEKLVKDYINTPKINRQYRNPDPDGIDNSTLLKSFSLARKLGYTANEQINDQLIDLFYRDMLENGPYDITTNLLPLLMPEKQSVAEEKLLAKSLLKNKDKLLKMNPAFFRNIYGNNVHNPHFKSTQLQGDIWSGLTHDEKKDIVDNAIGDKKYQSINSLNIVKDALALGGKKPWMFANKRMIDDLSDEDHDWVLQNFGGEPYHLDNRYDIPQTPSAAIRTLRHNTLETSDHIGLMLNGVLDRYTDDETLTKILEALRKTKYFTTENMKQSLNPSKSEYVEANKLNEVLGILLGSALKNNQLHILEKFVPKDVIYNPWMAFSILHSNKYHKFAKQNGDNKYLYKVAEFIIENPELIEKFGAGTVYSNIALPSNNKKLIDMILSSHLDASDDKKEIGNKFMGDDPMEYPFDNEKWLQKIVNAADKNFYKDTITRMVHKIVYTIKQDIAKQHYDVQTGSYDKEAIQKDLKPYMDGLKKILQIRPLPLYEALTILQNVGEDFLKMLPDIYTEENLRNVDKEQLGFTSAIRGIHQLAGTSVLPAAETKSVVRNVMKKLDMKLSSYLKIHPQSFNIELFDKKIGFEDQSELSDAVSALIKNVSRPLTSYDSTPRIIAELKEKYGDAFIKAVKEHESEMNDFAKAVFDKIVST